MQEYSNEVRNSKTNFYYRIFWQAKSEITVIVLRQQYLVNVAIQKTLKIT